MKFSKFAALCALSLMAVPGFTEARKFGPTSFVVKKPYNAGTALTDALLAPESVDKNVSSNPSITNRGGGIMQTLNEQLKGLTWFLDVIWSLGIFVFMLVWLKSKNLYEASPTGYLDVLPNFNKQVLEDGFCVNREATGLGTLKLCGIADALLIITSYLKFKDQLHIGINKTLFLGSVGYTILHGSIHFFELSGSGQIWNLQQNSLISNIAGVGLLALITLFTPVAIKGNFEAAEKEGGLFFGVAAWIAFILYYMFGIKDKVYALTYINLTIYLSMFGSRALLFKADDERRLAFYKPGFLKMSIAATANILIMCFEPLACSSWFAKVGGHVWFDITLWFFLMSAMES